MQRVVVQNSRAGVNRFCVAAPSKCSLCLDLSCFFFFCNYQCVLPEDDLTLGELRGVQNYVALKDCSPPTRAMAKVHYFRVAS